MEEEKKIVILNIDDILPNRFQPRIKFSENAINELAESIKLHGVIQPIVVRKISDKYEIIAGERRYKASIIAGKTTIPALITSLDDRNSAEVALIENVQRQALTPIEEAISYKKILDMGYINQQELGSKLGKKQSTIANKLRLLNLNDEVQEALMENKISERHARSLLKLDDKMQVLMLNRIINERLTVRKTDQEIAKLLESDNGEQMVKKEEKGEENMNNDILKDFNIPTEPIVNDNDSIQLENNQAQPTQSVTDTPTVSEPISNETPVVAPVNPGFMDIDKIQSEAQDIITEPAPAANMDDLLRPTATPDVPKQVAQPEETLQADVPQGGKFFNMFDFSAPENDQTPVQNIENQQVNMDFGVPTTPATPAGNLGDGTMDVFGQNDLNSVEAPTELRGADELDTNPTLEPAPVETQESAPIAPIAEAVSTPEMAPIQATVEAPTPEVAVAPIMEQSVAVETPAAAPVEPAPIEAPSVETPVTVSVEPTQPVETPAPFEPVASPLSLTDEDEFTKVEEPVAQVQPTQPATDYNQVSRPYMMDEDVKFDDEGEIEVQLPDQNKVQATVDMKTVINTIRECAAQIEKFGYRVETDELDLADSYEVTFKIEKND